ncbi:hypothetical protein ACVWY3_004704 [Bradyrhizobium sp. USDA 4486]
MTLVVRNRLFAIAWPAGDARYVIVGKFPFTEPGEPTFRQQSRKRAR